MTPEEAKKKIEDLAKVVGQDVAKELQEFADTKKLDALAGLVEKVARYKGLALCSTSAADVKKWSNEAEIVLTTLELKLVQEKIIADAKIAAVIRRAIAAAASTFAFILKETLALAVEAVVKGAASGLTGGTGGPSAPKRA